MIATLAQRQSKTRQGQGTIKASGLVALFSLLLLLVQGAYLVHTHDGELEAQFNCHLCMKLGAGDDAPLLAVNTFDYARASVAPPQLTYSLLPTAVSTANARSPPLH